MSRDFTLAKYSELCQALKSNYKILRVRDYMAKKNDFHGKCIAILRHDVDRYPDRSLNMAKLEKTMNICSTYYFRIVPEIFQPEIIKKIEKMGHEIGYHYEVLDKTKGNIKKALELFKQELKEMRAIVDIKTACMHGSPLKSWRNLDIWQKSKPEDYGLVGEPYLSLDYKKIIYYTDTGRRWDGEKYSVDDHVKQSKTETARSTNDLINIVNKKAIPQVLIQTHPQRWTGGGAWVRELIGQNVKNVGKRMLRGGGA
jgi:hypothetical protein